MGMWRGPGGERLSAPAGDGGVGVAVLGVGGLGRSGRDGAVLPAVTGAAILRITGTDRIVKRIALPLEG